MYQKIAKDSEEWIFWKELYKFREDHLVIRHRKELEQMVDDADKFYERFKGYEHTEQLARKFLVTMLEFEEDKFCKIRSYAPSKEFVKLESEVM